MSAGLCLGTMWGCGTQADPIGEIVTFPLPQTSEESEIFLAPIPDIADDFIRGMDASAVLAEEKSGVKYYNYDGCNRRRTVPES